MNLIFLRPFLVALHQACSETAKFQLKRATDRANATFGKRHNRVFATAEQTKEALRRYLDEVSALQPAE